MNVVSNRGMSFTTILQTAFNMIRSLPVFFLIALLTLLSSCTVVGGIFKAGVWVGVLVVVAILALVIWLVTKSGSGKS